MVFVNVIFREVKLMALQSTSCPSWRTSRARTTVSHYCRFFKWQMLNFFKDFLLLTKALYIKETLAFLLAVQPDLVICSHSKYVRTFEKTDLKLRQYCSSLGLYDGLNCLVCIHVIWILEKYVYVLIGDYLEVHYSDPHKKIYTVNVRYPDKFGYQMVHFA